MYDQNDEELSKKKLICSGSFNIAWEQFIFFLHNDSSEMF